MGIRDFLRSIGCKTALNNCWTLDGFSTDFYLRFDCDPNPEDDESLETCDLYAVESPLGLANRILLIRNASPPEIVQFMLSLKSARYSGDTLRALQGFVEQAVSQEA